MTDIVDDDAAGGEVITEIGPWAMVPVWVLSKDLKPAELVTYVALRSFADRAGGAHPRAETIAERANLSVGTVRNSIQGLRSKGLLTTTERRRADGSLAGLTYKLFDIDPSPAQTAEPRRRGAKPGRKPGQKPSSAAGTSSNVDPSTEGAEAPAGTSSNADPLHQVMQGSAPTNAGKNTPREHTTGTPSDSASQSRRTPNSDEGLPDGQTTIDGKVEPGKSAAQKKAEQEAGAVAGSWVEVREKHGCPIVIRGRNADPVAAVRSLVLPALLAGYTDIEVKKALAWIDTGIPSAVQLDTALAKVKGGWRPPDGWKPGDPRVLGGAGRQRTGTGPMAGTNRHVDDISAERRDAENPFHAASRQSDYAEGVVA
jgi:hypothetical protein